MPIANTTVVNMVNNSRTSDSSKQSERRVKEKRQEETAVDQDLTASLFEIKESKYHEDMFARD